VKGLSRYENEAELLAGAGHAEQVIHLHPRPKVGGSSISCGLRSMTCRTESTITPITVASPSHSTSVITMQVSFPATLGDCLNFTARSITGTTLPRRLITPEPIPASWDLGNGVVLDDFFHLEGRLTAYSSLPIMTAGTAARPARLSDSFSSSLIACQSAFRTG